MGIVKKIFKPYMGLPKAVYVIFISKIVNAMGAFVIPLLTLILTKKIGLAEDDAGFYIALLGFIYMPAALIGGKIADSFGRKKVIVIFGTLGAACYFLCSTIETSITTVFLIGGASFFFGIAGPAHDALIADITTPENREGAYSLSYLGHNMGYALGPAIGGLLFENHFRWVFIGDAVTAILAISLVLIFVKDTLSQSKEEVFDENRTMEKHVNGSVIKVLLDRPILIFYAIIMFGYSFVRSEWSFLVPLHTEANYANSGAKLFGYIASFNGAVVMLFTATVTALLVKTKINNIRKIAIGGVFHALGLGMLGFFSNKTAFFVSMFIFTIGEIIVVVSASPFIMNHTPASHRGRVGALLPTIIGFGHVLGPLITGKILQVASIETMWKIVLVIMLIFSYFMILLEKNEGRLGGKVKQRQQINA
ncbi:MFS transporter [Clostridiaceae bacterium M8S5]|nr:MFS transporter [Clostridiaceae bacterium M8S5]